MLHKPRPRPARGEAGFTLTELMVVITIIAILAAITVPSLMGDDIEAHYKRFVALLQRDIQRAHMEAIASKEDRRLLVYGTYYQLQSIDTSGTAIDLARRDAPEGVWIAKVTDEGDLPWANKAGPGTNAPWADNAELRFRGFGQFEISINGAGLQSKMATVYIGSTGNRYADRVVLFPATSFAKHYQGW